MRQSQTRVVSDDIMNTLCNFFPILETNIGMFAEVNKVRKENVHATEHHFQKIKISYIPRKVSTFSSTLR